MSLDEMRAMEKSVARGFKHKHIESISYYKKYIRSIWPTVSFESWFTREIRFRTKKKNLEKQKK